jgi:hypothetical protein
VSETPEIHEKIEDFEFGPPLLEPFELRDAYSGVLLRVVPSKDGGAVLTLSSRDDLTQHQMGIELDGDAWQLLLNHAAPLAQYARQQQENQDQWTVESSAAELRERQRYAFGLRGSPFPRRQSKSTLHLSSCAILRRGEFSERGNSTPFNRIEQFFRTYALLLRQGNLSSEILLCGSCKPLGVSRNAYLNKALRRLPEHRDEVSIVTTIIEELRTVQDVHQACWDMAANTEPVDTP